MLRLATRPNVFPLLRSRRASLVAQLDGPQDTPSFYCGDTVDTRIDAVRLLPLSPMGDRARPLLSTVSQTSLKERLQRVDRLGPNLCATSTGGFERGEAVVGAIQTAYEGVGDECSGRLQVIR